MLVESTGISGLYADVVGYTPIINSGTAKISFLQYLPLGKSNHINLQHNYTGSSADYALAIIMNDPQTYVRVNDKTTYFPEIENQWVEFRFELNYEIDSAYFYYDNELITAWQLSRNTSGNIASINQINAINFTAPKSVTGSQALFNDLRIEQYAVNTTDINALENTIKVFPNPTVDKLMIETTLDEPMDMHYSLIDINGSVIMEWTENQVINTQSVKDVSHLPNGLYFVRVFNEKETVTKKLLIQK